MPDRRMISFLLDEELIGGLDRVRERDGMNASEQIRRAVRRWLEEKGIALKSAGKGGTRRKTTRK